MFLKVFTVYDCKAEAYLAPFCLQSRGQAIRAITDLANENGHQFSKYPGDFTLFEIGQYDDSKGRFEMLEAHVNLGTCLEYKRPSTEPVPLLEGVGVR